MGCGVAGRFCCWSRAVTPIKTSPRERSWRHRLRQWRRRRNQRWHRDGGGGSAGTGGGEPAELPLSDPGLPPIGGPDWQGELPALASLSHPSDPRRLGRPRAPLDVNGDAISDLLYVDSSGTQPPLSFSADAPGADSLQSPSQRYARRCVRFHRGGCFCAT